MRIKKFNEDLNSQSNPHRPMKQFVLTTTSESSDHYIYFIEHPQMPTREELKKVLGGTEGSGSGSETCTNNACGALNLPCCSSSDYCSGVSKSDVCVPRPKPN